MSETRKIRNWPRIVVGIFLVFLLMIVLRVWLAPEILVPTKTPIRFDDFRFEVIGAREAALGSGESRSPYRIVSLQVHNEAKRVTYQFDPRIAILVDDAGREYGVSAQGQTALDLERRTPNPLAAPLPPGVSGTTELAFALPETAKNPRLKISHGGPILDVVDDLIGGRRRLLLR